MSRPRGGLGHRPTSLPNSAGWGGHRGRRRGPEASRRGRGELGGTGGGARGESRGVSEKGRQRAAGLGGAATPASAAAGPPPPPHPRRGRDFGTLQGRPLHRPTCLLLGLTRSPAPKQACKFPQKDVHEAGPRQRPSAGPPPGLLGPGLLAAHASPLRSPWSCRRRTRRPGRPRELDIRSRNTLSSAAPLWPLAASHALGQQEALPRPGAPGRAGGRGHGQHHLEEGVGVHPGAQRACASWTPSSPHVLSAQAAGSSHPHPKALPPHHSGGGYPDPGPVPICDRAGPSLGMGLGPGWDFRQKHRDLDGTLCGGFKAARCGGGDVGVIVPLAGTRLAVTAVHSGEQPEDAVPAWPSRDSGRGEAEHKPLHPDCSGTCGHSPRLTAAAEPVNLTPPDAEEVPALTGPPPPPSPAAGGLGPDTKAELIFPGEPGGNASDTAPPPPSRRPERPPRAPAPSPGRHQGGRPLLPEPPGPPPQRRPGRPRELDIRSRNTLSSAAPLWPLAASHALGQQEALPRPGAPGRAGGRGHGQHHLEEGVGVHPGAQRACASWTPSSPHVLSAQRPAGVPPPGHTPSGGTLRASGRGRRAGLRLGLPLVAILRHCKTCQPRPSQVGSGAGSQPLLLGSERRPILSATGTGTCDAPARTAELSCPALQCPLQATAQRRSATPRVRNQQSPRSWQWAHSAPTVATRTDTPPPNRCHSALSPLEEEGGRGGRHSGEEGKVLGLKPRGLVFRWHPGLSDPRPNEGHGGQWRQRWEAQTSAEAQEDGPYTPAPTLGGLVEQGLRSVVRRIPEMKKRPGVPPPPGSVTLRT
ncbi:basic proline-rich protein-like [Mesoplodon densirostris]|uniref:basic proline-rich protein-like n=1 Tax=Mesoplodon densirostris TaxID=48708 RepID=UPI0028DB87B4|nr:basic proline-rich protein-like [Mesoplodon densirostris]